MASEYDIGPRVGVKGESEFRKSLADINTHIKTLGTEMKATTAAFADNEKSTKALKEQQKLLKEQVADQKEKVALLKQGLKESQEQFGENAKKTEEWKQKVNLANAELSKLESAQKKNKEELKESKLITTKLSDAYNDMKDKAEKLAKHHPILTGALKATGEAAKTVADLVGKAGAAAAAAGAAVGAAAVGLAKAAVDNAKAIATQGDEVDKVSQKMGMSAEEYQKWDYVLGQSGVEITSMTTGLKTMTNQIDDAKNGTEKAVKRFEMLGISVEDLSTMSREDVFSAVITGMQGMADSTERAALANDLFGKSGQELTPLFNSSVEDTEELKKTAVELGFVMSNDAVAASADFNDALDTLQRTFGGVKNKIVSQLLPGMTQIMTGFTDLIAGNKEAAEEVKAGVKNIIESVRTATPQITGIIKELAPEIVQLVAEIAPPLMSATVEVLKELVSTMGQTLKDNWPVIKQAGTQLISALWGAVKEMVPWLWEQIKVWAPQVVKSVGTALKDNWPAIKEAGKKLISTLWDAVKSTLSWLWTQIKTWGPQVVGYIVQALKDQWPAIKDAGKNLISGLWNGISDMGSWIKDKIKGFASGIVDNIKDFFGIHSPSRVMRDQVGKNLALGIGEGFDRTMDTVARDMQSDLNGAIPGVNVTAPGTSAATFEIPITMTMDGERVAKVVSRHQWVAATGTVRNLGLAGVY